jgi:hypothetical protein
MTKQSNMGKRIVEDYINSAPIIRQFSKDATIDSTLITLFQAYRKDIEETIQICYDQAREKETTYKGMAYYTFEQFHKYFRQVGVITESADNRPYATNWLFWQLLGSSNCILPRAMALTIESELS